MLIALLAGFWQIGSLFATRDDTLANWPGVIQAPMVDAGSEAAIAQALTLNKSAAQTDNEFSTQTTSPISTSSIVRDGSIDTGNKVRRSRRNSKRRRRKASRRTTWIEDFHSQSR
ncbi:MAG: hypothetical protein ACI89J_001745 [Hyphomicrobiaceae bacterium]